MMSQLQVLLFRDSFSTPWGIRLQGGKDLTSPLLIQRVFPNSPAVGYLQRGDILLSINGKDASALSHKEAQDIFQSAGGQIPLLIRRINIQEKNPPQQKPKQHQQICPQPKPQQLKPHIGGTHKKPGKQLPFTPTMSPTLKTTTPTRKSPAKGKPKPKSFGGGGFSFGVDYSKVPVQEDYVPGPIYNEEELADELDQSYRTVPLDFEGPTSNMAHPHVPKGGMKYGGGGPIYGVNYAQAAVPAPVQRQSSKPWEDNEMLYKVQDTLSHISYPHQIGSYNGEPPQTHYQHVPAPPAYVPGPPPEPETYYVDPFPTNAPVPQQEEDEEYEFLPVSQRRNQFNKQDFVPDARKPIKPRSRPPSFKAPAPAPAPRPVSAPMHQPVYAPVARPAEGQVVSDEAPAWAGTLSSASGAKMWDAGYHPGHNVSPTRSVSPPKKAGKQHPPPAPRNPQEFSPTKTQALDFSNDPDDGPRIMHLQYNSPLGMYSNENVQETLQGQTQAALGGGNTAFKSSKNQPSDSQDPDNIVSVSQTVLHLANAPATEKQQFRPVVPPKPVRNKTAVETPESYSEDASLRPVTPTPFTRPGSSPSPRPITPQNEATPPQEDPQTMSRSERRRLAAQAQREKLAAEAVAAACTPHEVVDKEPPVVPPKPSPVAEEEAPLVAEQEVPPVAEQEVPPVAEQEESVKDSHATQELPVEHEPSVDMQDAAPAIAAPTQESPAAPVAEELPQSCPPTTSISTPELPRYRPPPTRDLTSSQASPTKIKKKDEEEEELTPNYFRIAVFVCLCAFIICMWYMNKQAQLRRKVAESMAMEDGPLAGNAGQGGAPGDDLPDDN